ncbi:MAG: LacI family DNA-binding transcriptional regulator, partial [Clostridium sp.]
IEQEMTALGYTCITLSTGRRDEKKADYIRILEQRRVDGAILMGSMFETEAVKKSIKEHLPDVPVAIVNGYLDLPNVYGILIDEERGVKDCAELMFKKGKKHLVMAVDSDTPSNRNKQKGYLRAMLEQGIAKEDIPFYTAVNKEFTNPRDVRAAGAKLTEQILTERPETDGIIYTTDLLAVGGLEAAKKMGKRIPQDLAIMGIDNTMYGEIVTPKLSSLDNKLVEVSQNASRAILDALDKKEVSHKVMLLTDIKERETT